MDREEQRALAKKHDAIVCFGYHRSYCIKIDGALILVNTLMERYEQEKNIHIRRSLSESIGQWLVRFRRAGEPLIRVNGRYQRAFSGARMSHYAGTGIAASDTEDETGNDKL